MYQLFVSPLCVFIFAWKKPPYKTKLKKKKLTPFVLPFHSRCSGPQQAVGQREVWCKSYFKGWTGCALAGWHLALCRQPRGSSARGRPAAGTLALRRWDFLCVLPGGLCSGISHEEHGPAPLQATRQACIGAHCAPAGCQVCSCGPAEQMDSLCTAIFPRSASATLEAGFSDYICWNHPTLPVTWQ